MRFGMKRTPTPEAAWLRERSGAVRRLVSWAISVGCASGLLLIVQAAFMADVVNRALFGSADLRAVALPLAGILVFLLLRTAAAYVVERLGFRAAARVRREVRSRILGHLAQLGPAGLGGSQAGDVANTLIDAVEALAPYYASYLPQTALAVLVPLSILAVVFPMDWTSGLILLVTAPLIPVFMILIGAGAERLNRRQWRRLGALSGHFLDTVGGLTTLRLFGLARREAALIERISDEYRAVTMGVLRVAFLSALVLEFLATVSIAMVAVIIGFRLMWGDLGFRTGFLVLLLAPEFYGPLRQMGAVYHARMGAIGAAERIVELLNRPTPARPDGAGARRRLPEARARRLDVRDLRVTYPDGHEALRGISFDVLAGETVALVGPSAAGKTTLLQVLLGFMEPTSGSVAIDGVPLHSLDTQDWREQVAWVPQTPHLFKGSVLDNVRVARPQADRATVEAAIRMAQAEDFVRRLPHGLDTPVGENGAGLSGGEVQRLAVARAFLKNAPLVLLDEAGAYLDAENEARLNEALHALSQGRTVIMVSHRLASVRAADRILVLSKGRLIESGPHASLVRAGGLYASMAGAI